MDLDSRWCDFPTGQTAFARALYEAVHIHPIRVHLARFTSLVRVVVVNKRQFVLAAATSLQKDRRTCDAYQYRRLMLSLLVQPDLRTLYDPLLSTSEMDCMDSNRFWTA